MRDQVELAASDARRWYVVNTHPTQEYLAQRCLLREFFLIEREDGETQAAFDARAIDQIWLPQCVVRTSSRRCREMTHKGALFPTYLFVHLTARHRWRSIQEVIGVSRVLCNGDSPLALPCGWIEDLKRLVAADGGALLIDVGSKRPKYVEGDALKVIDGPFQGFIGLYVAEVKERITLLLDMMGTTVPIEAGEAQVEPA